MISVKVSPPSGTIILERPNRCNALSRSMVADISQAIDDLRQEKKVRGIVLTGSGAHFCSGLDLKELNETASNENATQEWFAEAQALQALTEQMLQCPKPLIAAVDGAAIAAGLGLVLACDLVVASHSAQFSVPAPRIGIVSGITVPLLAFRLGASIASQIVLGGDKISAKEAKSIGLVHHVVESDQVWVRSTNWIESIAEGASESIQLTKRVLNEMVGESLFSALSSGAAATATSLTTEAAIEGLAAFEEKREPKFP